MQRRDDLPYERARARLVEHLRRFSGIQDERVLEAIARVPRHEMVPPHLRAQAYDDVALPIGLGQTISQPTVVAVMTEAARVRPTDRVLEVGTGSGYQTAVLAELAREVFTVEVLSDLAERARERLEPLHYENIHFRVGDGSLGWPEEAPFDAILCAAAPREIPEPLLEQLAPGGRLVIPVGEREQELLGVTKRMDGRLDVDRLGTVRFVRMTGAAGRSPRR